MGTEPGPFGTLSIGLLPDAVESGFHGVKTHWIRGFIAFRLARRTRIMMLMVPVWPESSIRYLPAVVRCAAWRPEDITALETVSAMTSPGW